ncbi:MAG: sodium:solute symporter [Vicinamibacterales bacterium]
MNPIDWLIVVVYLVWMIWDGIRLTKNSREIDGYFLANRSLPWWAVGLSVMATQLSAITLVGTTGQGYADGLRFVQFYFGLPLAMVVLSFTVVPFFYRAHVYTAYEYLERRFDSRTRALTSILFLASRGLSCGVIISAPALVLSIILGLNLTLTVLLIAVPTALYTMVGGVQAVAWTDVKQMVLIVAAVFFAVGMLLAGLPGEVGFVQALELAGSTSRLKALDFSFDPNETYTFWSGLIGGLFLMLSYFGCDQSQVQRYLTSKSIAEARSSLMMSAYVKIPLQALILLMGVLVFVYYLFVQPPMLFNPSQQDRVESSSRAGEYMALQQEFESAFGKRREAAFAAAAAGRRGDAEGRRQAKAVLVEADNRLKEIRERATRLVREVSGDSRYNDINYVFPTFVTTRLPVGLVGLLIAGIMAAAMSSISAELNSLATTTIVDVYRRHMVKTATDAHYLLASKLATGFWGIFAAVVALYAVSLGSLIEVVNRFGSFFYGSLLGVFVLAIGTRRATGRGAFWGLVAGMFAVGLVAFGTSISFLWHNLVGVLVVVIVGMALSYTDRRRPPKSTDSDGRGNAGDRKSGD